jgi:hypothetical protein
MPETPDEELVRRLLADARHDEPMPADVAARLDGVLADLAAESSEVSSSSPSPPGRLVTPLRRSSHRRRWGAALVAAAAAVTAFAVLPGIDLPSDDGAGSSDSTAADSAGGSASDSGSDSADGKAEEASPRSPGIALLSTATLESDVRAARRRFAGRVHQLQSGAATADGCPLAVAGPGEAVPARLDGEAVLLVLRPAADGHQVADVLACGSDRVLASVTLPAR